MLIDYQMEGELITRSLKAMDQLDRKLGCRSKTSKKDTGFAQCLEYLYRQEHPMIVESMFINVVDFSGYLKRMRRNIAIKKQ